MTSNEEQSLPRRKTFGPFVRIVEPDRHIYASIIDYRRWMFFVGCIAGAILMGWGARGAWIESSATHDGTYSIVTGVASVVVGLVMVLLVCMAAVLMIYGTRLEITARTLILVRRDLIGRTTGREWDINEFYSVLTENNPTFHVGGTTPIFSIELVFTTGEIRDLLVNFDIFEEAERMVNAIIASVALMRGAASP